MVDLTGGLRSIFSRSAEQPSSPTINAIEAQIKSIQDGTTTPETLVSSLKESAQAYDANSLAAQLITKVADSVSTQIDNAGGDVSKDQLSAIYMTALADVGKIVPSVNPEAASAQISGALLQQTGAVDSNTGIAQLNVYAETHVAWLANAIDAETKNDPSVDQGKLKAAKPQLSVAEQYAKDIAAREYAVEQAQTVIDARTYPGITEDYVNMAQAEIENVMNGDSIKVGHGKLFSNKDDRIEFRNQATEYSNTLAQELGIENPAFAHALTEELVERQAGAKFSRSLEADNQEIYDAAEAAAKQTGIDVVEMMASKLQADAEDLQPDKLGLDAATTALEDLRNNAPIEVKLEQLEGQKAEALQQVMGNRTYDDISQNYVDGAQSKIGKILDGDSIKVDHGKLFSNKDDRIEFRNQATEYSTKLAEELGIENPAFAHALTEELVERQAGAKFSRSLEADNKEIYAAAEAAANKVGIDVVETMASKMQADAGGAQPDMAEVERIQAEIDGTKPGEPENAASADEGGAAPRRPDGGDVAPAAVDDGSAMKLLGGPSNG